MLEENPEGERADDGGLAEDGERVVVGVFVRVEADGDGKHHRREEDAEDELLVPLPEQHREPGEQQLAERLDGIQPRTAGR